MTGVQTCALRSEEHTSELQSHDNLVCRLLLEKKKETTLLPHRRPPSTRAPGTPPRGRRRQARQGRRRPPRPRGGGPDLLVLRRFLFLKDWATAEFCSLPLHDHFPI